MINLTLLATWMALSFSAPADPPGVAVARYVVEAQDVHGGTWTLQPCSDPKSGRIATPKAPGKRETIWVGLFWDGMLFRLRVAGIDAAGNRSAWSNPIYVVSGTRDSLGLTHAGKGLTWWNGRIRP